MLRRIVRENGVDPAGLRELNLVARESVVPDSGCGFPEDAEHLEADAIGNLPLTGLIGGGDPGVDGDALSRLNPLGYAAGKRLILLVR